MIKEIKYPYKELSKLEKERIESFRSYHLVDYNNIYVYYITDLSLGAGYEIIVSLNKIKNTKNIEFNDITKNITDIDKELKTF